MSMTQRRLYRTIESFASDHFKTDIELLKHVINEIVKNESIDIKGGRVWKYVSTLEAYTLVHQIGVIERLSNGYNIPVATYPMFLRLDEHRSIMAKETDEYLQKKGIHRYSATGVGERIRYNDGYVYEYVLACNSDALDEDLLTELNIIGLAVNSLLRGRKIERKAELLEKDIDRASEIQKSVLPEPFLQFHHYEIYGTSVQDGIVGGDFFDYIAPDEEKDRMSVILGDVASKGLQAAAQALYVVGALRMAISYHPKISSLMSRLNIIVNQTFTEEQFVSMFYAEFSNDQKGLVLYANAGHNSPFVYHTQDHTIEELKPTGQILGPFREEKYRVENTMLKPGDALLMYSDGISEAVSIREEIYGEERLTEKLRKLHSLSAREICEGILTDVKGFSRGSAMTDDKTVVVVKRIH